MRDFVYLLLLDIHNQTYPSRRLCVMILKIIFEKLSFYLSQQLLSHIKSLCVIGFGALSKSQVIYEFLSFKLFKISFQSRLELRISGENFISSISSLGVSLFFCQRLFCGIKVLSQKFEFKVDQGLILVDILSLDTQFGFLIILLDFGGDFRKGFVILFFGVLKAFWSC